MEWNNELNSEEQERYARQIMLPDFGEAGQKKLKAARVLVIGAGGLGSPAAFYLAAAGIGTVGLADFDHVELSNLQRQLLHTTADLGRRKIDSGRETLQALNPALQVPLYDEPVTEEYLAAILRSEHYDMVVDAVDDAKTKFAINDACVQTKTAFVHGGILKYQGQLMTYVPGSPCLRCLFPEAQAARGGKNGVLGAVPGVIGSLQATEVIKYLLGMGNLLAGRLLTYDSLPLSFRILNIPKRAECSCQDIDRSGRE
ncbi:putative ThiF family protein [Selenomonas ruminantium subsp. lactilytica TAM6421]|uniref:Putative ThiF family protein n=1 Tax=Selenomonas ruminantium subsp. lactilytica (strain NBRC 103574 / TAM6421) TaxID=927704 RepID=I0GNI5_SELRL|nr:HesA/MoeB/ThiF family protein [Selenomonas ruminantium]BAL82322.1 putative ThiF family protein [Selenomonas ruminantium subsp. lactilytica TAM6421]